MTSQSMLHLEPHQNPKNQRDVHLNQQKEEVSSNKIAAIQAQKAPSLGVTVSSRTIRRLLVEGHLGAWRPLRVLLLPPTHQRFHLEWCRTQGNWTAVEWNQVVFSEESRFNLSSEDSHVRVWRARGERALILPLLYRDTPLPQPV
ncbi:transposable element Tcb2 transposase [Trichonephila clavipes]|nr:transposable element Tcb2 transposase [Trichonephila clavipes]